MRWLLAALLNLSLGAVCAPAIAAAGGVPPVSISLDLNIEGRYVPSALVLSVPLRRHVLFGAAVKDLDAGDRAAADFIEALARGNLGFTRERWDGPVDPPKPGAVAAAGDGAGATPLVSYLAFMSTFRDVGMLGRVPSDDGELVLFRANSRGTVIVRAFRMRSVAGQWRFSEVNVGSHAADSFLVNSFAGIHDERLLSQRLKRAGTVKVPGDLYRVPVNARGAELQFRGSRPGGSIPTLDTQADLVLRMLSARILLLGNEQTEELKRLMTADSFRRYEQWRRSMAADALRAFADAQTVARKVLFVMNLGSATLVFYAGAGDLVAHGMGQVSYEYIGNGNERAQVANVFLESVFDDFLRSSAEMGKLLSAP